MLTRFFTHLKTYRFIYLFNCGVLLGGFLSGCLVFQRQDHDALAKLNELMTSFLSIAYIKDPAMIQENLLSNVFLVLVIFFLGFSILGIPVLSFILFSKGMQVGFSCMLYLEAYALKGLAGIILTLIPFVFFELLAFIVLIAVAYEISLSLIMTSFMKKQTLSFKAVLNHFLNYLFIALILVFISTLFKIYLLPYLYQLFNW